MGGSKLLSVVDKKEPKKITENICILNQIGIQ